MVHSSKQKLPTQHQGSFLKMQGMRAGACKLLGFLGMREGQGMRVRSARHSHIPYLIGWKVQGWGWDEFLEKAKSE